MIYTPPGFDQNIAHIGHKQAGDEYVFQVISAEGDDWDEAATVAAYHAWIEENT